jgi:hypothetical protein
MSERGSSPNRNSVQQSRFREEMADLELPERSKLKLPLDPAPKEASLKQSQNQEQDEELFALELLPNSHIIAKVTTTPSTS